MRVGQPAGHIDVLGQAEAEQIPMGAPAIQGHQVRVGVAVGGEQPLPGIAHNSEQLRVHQHLGEQLFEFRKPQVLQEIAGEIAGQQVAALDQPEAGVEVFVLPGAEQPQGLLDGAAGRFGDVQKNQLAAAIERHVQRLEHQQLLGGGIPEPQLAIEAAAVGGHQIHPLHTGDAGGMQQLLNHAAPQALPLQIAGHDDVPEHSTAEAVGIGSAEAHQAFTAPETHHRITADQQTPELGKAATAGPEGMPIEQALQFQQGAAGAEIRSEAEPAQTRCSWSVANELNRGHSL